MQRMQALGFPSSDRMDHFLLRNDSATWGDVSDKRPRRECIARTHRVVMLVGDDLGDFIPAPVVAALLRSHYCSGHEDAPECTSLLYQGLH